ncbi:MAG: rRNA pseudouridine synthase [Oscillospiraceae bacterium]|nr:rRNA pseudouridine synthase [Oscillospiraceae bacterium]
MRIQKLLAERGIASRRAAEQMVINGRVTVNGETAAVGQAVDARADIIAVDGKPIPTRPDLVYIMLHKPRGVMTTLSDDRGRECVKDYIEDITERVVPVGRLDYDSEGLLLMTNDGDLVHNLTHPSHEVHKAYRVRVKGDITGGLKRLNRSIKLDGKPIPPPDDLELVEHFEDKGTILITIHTGVNRQIRRMCEMAGLRVQRLRRVRMGPLQLGDLKPGKYRHLTPGEVEWLKSL